MLQINVRWLTLRVETLLKGFERPTVLDKPEARTATQEGLFTRVKHRLEALDSEAAEDRDGFWGLLAWNNQMRPQ